MKNRRFKTREDVLAYLEGDKIECLVCGNHYIFLPSHTVSKHNMSKEEYCNEFGIPQHFPLCSSQSSKAKSSSAKLRVENDPEYRETLTKRMDKHRGEVTRKGKALSLPSIKLTKSNRENIKVAQEIFATGSMIMKDVCTDCGEPTAHKTNAHVSHRKNIRCRDCADKHLKEIQIRTRSKPANIESARIRRKKRYDKVKSDPELWAKELKRRADNKRKLRGEKS